MNTCLFLRPSSALDIANSAPDLENVKATTFTRRTISKLAAQVLDYLNDRCDIDEYPIVLEYLTAIRNLDYDRLMVFASFGDCVRQIVMNIHYYRQAQTFGFTSYSFGEYGWLERYEFASRETFSLKVKGDNCYFNHFDVAQAPNGSWVYGFTITCGGAGSSSGIGIWNKPYPSKEECILAAFNHFKSHFEVAITKKDPTNYRMPYCQHVLNLIKTKFDEARGVKRDKKGQLAMF